MLSASVTTQAKEQGYTACTDYIPEIYIRFINKNDQPDILTINMEKVSKK